MQYILYHEVKKGVACADGIVAAWVASRAYPDAEIHGCVYQEPAPICPCAGDSVVVVDFSFPAETLIQWKDDGAIVALIDHHKTAKEMLGGLLSLESWLHFDMEECGATLAWKTFFPDEPMPAFLEFVRSRDLWLDCDLFANPIPDTLIVHEAMSGFRADMRDYARNSGEDEIDLVFEGLNNLSEYGRDELLLWARDVALPKLEAKRDKCRAIAARHEWTSFDSPLLQDMPDDLLDEMALIPIVELAKDGTEDRYTSDVCMVLYRQFPDTPFVACITSDGSWSLRSDKDGSNTDVGAIAKALGGGGHHNAAGFHPQKMEAIAQNAKD